MRASALAHTAFIILTLALLGPAIADEHDPNVKGLYLMTDYPAVTIRPGTTSNIPLRLQNYGLAPDRYQLSVSGVPNGWTATILGGGQPVAAAMPAPDKDVTLQLRLDVPANSKLDQQTLTVEAKGPGNQTSLPIQVALAKELPAKLTVKSQLPAARQPEIQLRIHAVDQERLRAQPERQLLGAGARKFRNLVHGGLWQPGALLDSDRCRPVQGRQAQGAAAKHD